jgi:hypothetical protein
MPSGAKAFPNVLRLPLGFGRVNRVNVVFQQEKQCIFRARTVSQWKGRWKLPGAITHQSSIIPIMLRTGLPSFFVVF